MLVNAESDAQGGRYLGDENWKGLLEVMSLEVPAESVGTVAGAHDEIAYFTVRWKTRASFVYRTSWRQRVPDFRGCDREAASA